MEIEIKDELEDRVEVVREEGVRKGIYPVGTTPEVVIENLVRKGIAEEEKKLWKTPLEALRDRKNIPEDTPLAFLRRRNLQRNINRRQHVVTAIALFKKRVKETC